MTHRTLVRVLVATAGVTLSLFGVRALAVAGSGACQGQNRENWDALASRFKPAWVACSGDCPAVPPATAACSLFSLGVFLIETYPGSGIFVPRELKTCGCVNSTGTVSIDVVASTSDVLCDAFEIWTPTGVLERVTCTGACNLAGEECRVDSTSIHIVPGVKREWECECR